MGNLKTISNLATYLFFFLLLSGCAIHRAEVIDENALANKKKVFIYGLEDPINIKNNVSDGLTSIGFLVTEKKMEAELVADYKYKCFWDVIHYTCSEFNFFLTDPKTKKIVLKSRFWGSTPFSSKTLVTDLLKKVDRELQEKAVQPTGQQDR